MNALDRTTAAQTNPLISMDDRAETLARAAMMIRHVSYGVLPGSDALPLRETQLLLEAAARALDFEIAQGGDGHA
ncbi:MAG: hypothetical protein PHT19_06660 [Methylococcus sp.]|nr:hypothetical protein [Methylococcus sp.]